MDHVVTRLYQTLAPEQLDTLGNAYILSQLTPQEKRVLATKYWYFQVNVPVRVSVMRHEEQPVVPFWLETGGFQKTGMQVRNRYNTYEVWQKDFKAGPVELGINGFDKHRPVYFICVGPKDPGSRLEISGIFPEDQHLDTMRTGAFTYHDWDELILEEVPDELAGQVLFTTIRGRAREAHLTGAFRATPHPSGPVPDQILLTWGGDPSESMDIQWRTDTTVRNGLVKYCLKGDTDTLMVQASPAPMEDRLLRNDRYIHRFAARLEHLHPGAVYDYRVGSENGRWSDPASFRTAGDRGEGFSFIWFGDTHKSRQWGELLQASFRAYPGVAFYSIAGDIVSTGLYRDEWDQLFHFSDGVINQVPLMPVPGNHDSQDGLGAWMYRELFSLPENGPATIPGELTYSFTYGNALFLMIDATSPLDAQAAWIEQQLKDADAVWKFAMFHFPPYNYEEDYSHIREKWCVLFDRYHVDMVMSGHTHYYMRSKPLHREQVVEDPSQGTIYLISVGIPGNHQDIPDDYYAEAYDEGGWQYQYLEIKGNRLSYRSLDIYGNTKDSLIIKK
jgi:hypothetical protein